LDSLVVVGNITIENGAGLNANDQSLEILVSGDWTDYNSSYDSYMGFSSGSQSHVTFRTDESVIRSSGVETFNDLSLLNDGLFQYAIYRSYGELLIKNKIYLDSSLFEGHDNITFQGDVEMITSFIDCDSTILLNGPQKQALTHNGISLFGKGFYADSIILDKPSLKSGLAKLSDPGQSTSIPKISKSPNDTVLIGRFDMGSVNGMLISDGVLDIGGNLVTTNDIYINQGGVLNADPDNPHPTYYFPNLWNYEGEINVTNGGIFRFIGDSSNNSIMYLSHGSGLIIGTGGTIAAEYAKFQSDRDTGIIVESGGWIDPAYPFNRSVFQLVNPAYTGADTLEAFLTVENNQTLDIFDAEFKTPFSPGRPANVRKTTNLGTLNFIHATGILAGEWNDIDPYNRIHWYPYMDITCHASEDTICSGDTTTLSITIEGGMAPYSISWSPQASLSNLFGLSASAHPATSTTYQCIVIDNLGDSDTCWIDVYVNIKPTISLSPSPVSLCSGESTLLTASGGASYVWSNGLGSGNNKTVTPLTTTTYTVTGTDANGCTGTALVTVTVNPLPTVSLGASPSVLCSGGSSILTASGASTYAWSGGLGTGSSKTVSPLATTIYTVTGTDANGCTGTAQVTITVNPLPTVGIYADDDILCLGESSNLTASGASTYTWSHGLGTGSNKTVSPSATTTYAVTGTDINGCTGTAQISITVNPLPTVGLSASDLIICLSESSTLTASGASTYTWSHGLGTGSSKTVSPSATTTYTV
ncbi:MAG: hypothetical protein IH599_09065, partial [Bacteroidales bacterium]|nr:hypothetical protein [Bacteroidales bacterium]